MNLVQQQFLDTYLSTLSPAKRAQYTRFNAYHFCNDEAAANELADLVLTGEKRATASLRWIYQVFEEALPEVGQLDVITNFAGEPQCIVETTRVEIRPFKMVDADFAFTEGEGDKSLAYWRKVHWDFFEKECATIGKTPSEDMDVVLEYFELRFKKKAV